MCNRISLHFPLKPFWLALIPRPYCRKDQPTRRGRGWRFPIVFETPYPSEFTAARFPTSPGPRPALLLDSSNLRLPAVCERSALIEFFLSLRLEQDSWRCLCCHGGTNVIGQLALPHLPSLTVLFYVIGVTSASIGCSVIHFTDARQNRNYTGCMQNHRGDFQGGFS